MTRPQGYLSVGCLLIACLCTVGCESTANENATAVTENTTASPVTPSLSGDSLPSEERVEVEWVPFGPVGVVAPTCSSEPCHPETVLLASKAW